MDKKIMKGEVAIFLEKKIPFTNEQLRGYIGNVFLENPAFHHHSDRLIYRYPLIQYKQIDGNIVIIGLEECSKTVVEKIPTIDAITIKGKEMPIKRYEATLKEERITEKDTEYEFITPWIAFNQKNYRKYSSLKKEEMIKELERILVGNVLSFLKGCKITADCRIVAKIKCIRPVKVVAHSNAFMSFRGCFTLNLYLPDHIGLGKSASKGFGTIRKVGLYKGPAENQLANHHAQKEPLEASVCQKK